MLVAAIAAIPLFFVRVKIMMWDRTALPSRYSNWFLVLSRVRFLWSRSHRLACPISRCRITRS